MDRTVISTWHADITDIICPRMVVAQVALVAAERAYVVGFVLVDLLGIANLPGQIVLLAVTVRRRRVVLRRGGGRFVKAENLNAPTRVEGAADCRRGRCGPGGDQFFTCRLLCFCLRHNSLPAGVCRVKRLPLSLSLSLSLSRAHSRSRSLSLSLTHTYTAACSN